MAPSTSVPSSPRLMRPDFSVRHSPRATNMKGVETRIAPPSMAMRTVKRVSCIASSRFEELELAVERLRRQQDDEDEALQHQDGGVGHVHAALDEPARRRQTAEQDGHGNDGDRIVAGEKG